MSTRASASVEAMAEGHEKEEARAKALWRRNFIAEQMSFRAQQGALEGGLGARRAP